MGRGVRFKSLGIVAGVNSYIGYVGVYLVYENQAGFCRCNVRRDKYMEMILANLNPNSGVMVDVNEKGAFLVR